MEHLQRQVPIGLLIGAVRRRIKQAVGERVRGHGLSPQQFWLLTAVFELEGASLSELAERQRVDLPTASRVITALQTRGLVRSAGHPADRRRMRLMLTPRGRALAISLRGVVQEIRLTLVRGLDEAEQNRLRRSLGKMIANLDAALGTSSAAPVARVARDVTRAVARRPASRGPSDRRVVRDV